MTALIVVDVQNDFAHPDGNLYVNGGDQVADKVAELLGDYTTVVYTKDWHPAKTAHFVDYGGGWPRHCVANTWGSEFHKDLPVLEDAPVVLKGTGENEDGYSGFSVERQDGDVYHTELVDILNDAGETDVDVVGIALDVCVRATAADAFDRGFNTRVLVDYTAAVTETGGNQAIEDLRELGVVVD